MWLLARLGLVLSVAFAAAAASAAPSAGTLSLSAAAYTVGETAGSVLITVDRTIGSTGPVSVFYSTANGTATWSNYAPKNGRLFWNDGDNSPKSFSVPIRGRNTFSGSKQFTVDIKDVYGGAALGTQTATVSIQGGGSAGTLEFSSSSYSVSQSLGSLTVAVDRTGGSSGTVSVYYTTAAASATTNDFAQKNGRLTWADGDASPKTFVVPISNAVPFSGSKQFTVAIKDVYGAAQLSTPTTSTATIIGSAAGSGSPPPPPVSQNCGLQLGGSVIFCDTFDAPAGTGNRSGELNGNVWGVSRDVGDVNLGQGQYDAAPAVDLIGCNGTVNVRPPNDVIICNGQLREATNDNPTGVFEAGGVTVLAMYPKQPFDFAGRTGTASFDVSNDSHGTHAVWPEFWVADLPVPAPFTHFGSWIAFSPNGFGVRFAAQVGPGQWGLCPNDNNFTSSRWTVDSAVVIRNYIYEDANYQGVDFGTPSSPNPLKLNILDCVISPPDNSGIMNHIEVRVSQDQIDVYATDAGVAATPATLRHIASITNANLSFTRGLVWLEDVHYNADKGSSAAQPSQKEHTFVWDNVAFDGPFPGRDFTFDALDANTPGPAYGAWNLGKESDANQTASWNVLNVPPNPNPALVRVAFDFFDDGCCADPTVINVIVNGHAHPTPWPYPDTMNNSWRTLAVTIPVSDLVAGTNVVQLGADQPLISANVDIVLAGVPGAVPVLPGNSTVYPGSTP